MKTRRHISISAFTILEVMVAISVLTIGMLAVISGIANQDMVRRDVDDYRQARQVAEFILQGAQAQNWDDLNNLQEDDAYLYWARHPDTSNDGIDNDDNSLGDDRGLPLVVGTQDPRQRRRLPFQTTLDGLRVYVEYYRAHTALDSFGDVIRDTANGNAPCDGGLLDGTLVRTGSPPVWAINPAQVAERIQPAMTGHAVVDRLAGQNYIPRIGVTGGAAPILLPETESVASQATVRIGEHDPAAMRITVTWIDRRRPSPPPGEAPNRRMYTLISGKKR